MGDPLSIISGIVAVLQITSEVVKYGLDVADAPKAILDLKDEAESLLHLLKQLKQRCENALHPQKSPPDWLKGLWEVHRRFDKDRGWIVEYRGAVWRLTQAVNEAMAKLNPTKEWKNTETCRRITWRFRKEKFDEIRNSINRSLTAINMILELKNNETIEELKDLVKGGAEYNREQFTQLTDQFSASVKHQMEEVERRRKEDEEAEREEITKCLSPFSFVAKQDELFDKSFTQVGAFLWSDQRFQAWAEGRPWFLWCIGVLGVGKTVFSAILAHHLAQNISQGLPPPIFSIYLDYKSSKTETLEHLVGSLLQQLFQLNEPFPIPDELKTVHKEAKRRGIQARFVLQTSTRSIGKRAQALRPHLHHRRWVR